LNISWAVVQQKQAKPKTTVKLCYAHFIKAAAHRMCRNKQRKGPLQAALVMLRLLQECNSLDRATELYKAGRRRECRIVREGSSKRACSPVPPAVGFRQHQQSHRRSFPRRGRPSGRRHAAAHYTATHPSRKHCLERPVGSIPSVDGCHWSSRCHSKSFPQLRGSRHRREHQRHRKSVEMREG